MEMVETEFEILRIAKPVSLPFEVLILFMRPSTAPLVMRCLK